MTNIDPILDGFSDAELTAALDDRKAQRAANEAKKLDAVPPVFKFTLTRNHEPYYNGKVWDDSIEVWNLVRTCTNLDAAVAAGHRESDLTPRGHNYLFNRITGKFFFADGGGYIFASCHQAFTEMAYLVLGTYGSDTDFVVTSIIEDHARCGKGLGGFGKLSRCNLVD